MQDYISFLNTLRKKNPDFTDLWIQILFELKNTNRVKIPPIKKMDRFKKYRCVTAGIAIWKEIIKTPLELKKGYILFYEFQEETPKTEVQTTQEIIQQKKSKPRKPKPTSLNAEMYENVISYLNEKAGKHYKSTTKSYQKLIDGLFKSEYNLENIYYVIDNKCTEWIGTDFEKFLRPETLFGNKFETYLNQEQKSKQEKLFDNVSKATKLGWNN
jgi:uncharacterized phage protein (TIGR02220 family)